MCAGLRDGATQSKRRKTRSMFNVQVPLYLTALTNYTLKTYDTLDEQRTKCSDQIHVTTWTLFLHQDLSLTLTCKLYTAKSRAVLA